MSKKNTLIKIANKIGYSGKKIDINTEKEIANVIISPPNDVADIYHIYELFGKDYNPGTFKLAERGNKPKFLFDENILNYKEWVFDKVENELRLLSKIPEGKIKIEEYGETNLREDLYYILQFRISEKIRLQDIICNQEYSDIFRRIITVLLTGDILKTYDTHKEFNHLGRQVAIPVLKMTENYDLYERLKQSISSGLIGMDLKDEIAATSPLSRRGIIPLKKMQKIEDKVNFVKEELEKRIDQSLAIDFWNDYEIDVLNSRDKIIIAWFTDDYIPTIFEMKFIEEQLCYNDKLTVYIIPRRLKYGNDAGYADIIDLIQEPIFSRLKKFFSKDQIHICSTGPDMGTFNGFRISKEVAKILFSSDVVVITGARSYEMVQGIRKLTYFSGIAVCRKYTESVTGVDMDSGSSIFVRQDPGVPSFWDFKAREWRRMSLENGKSIPVARMTTLDYTRAIKSNNYKVILNLFDNNRNKANMWMLKKAKEQDVTFAEVINCINGGICFG